MKVNAVVIGDPEVGKTCSLLSFVNQTAVIEYSPSSVESYTVKLTADSRVITCVLHDTAGSDSFDPIRVHAYKDCNVVIIFFSLTCAPSLDRVLSKWYPEAQKYASGVPVILVGSFSDMNQGGVGSLSESAKNVAEQINARKYFEVCSMSPELVTPVFCNAAKAALLTPFPTTDVVCLSPPTGAITFGSKRPSSHNLHRRPVASSDEEIASSPEVLSASSKMLVRKPIREKSAEESKKLPPPPSPLMAPSNEGETVSPPSPSKHRHRHRHHRSSTGAEPITIEEGQKETIADGSVSPKAPSITKTLVKTGATATPSPITNTPPSPASPMVSHSPVTSVSAPMTPVVGPVTPTTTCIDDVTVVATTAVVTTTSLHDFAQVDSVMLDHALFRVWVYRNISTKLSAADWGDSNEYYLLRVTAKKDKCKLAFLDARAKKVFCKEVNQSTVMAVQDSTRFFVLRFDKPIGIGFNTKQESTSFVAEFMKKMYESRHYKGKRRVKASTSAKKEPAPSRARDSSEGQNDEYNLYMSLEGRFVQAMQSTNSFSSSSASSSSGDNLSRSGSMGSSGSSQSGESKGFSSLFHKKQQEVVVFPNSCISVPSVSVKPSGGVGTSKPVLRATVSRLVLSNENSSPRIGALASSSSAASPSSRPACSPKTSPQSGFTVSSPTVFSLSSPSGSSSNSVSSSFERYARQRAMALKKTDDLQSEFVARHVHRAIMEEFDRIAKIRSLLHEYDLNCRAAVIGEVRRTVGEVPNRGPSMSLCASVSLLTDDNSDSSDSSDMSLEDFSEEVVTLKEMEMINAPGVSDCEYFDSRSDEEVSPNGKDALTPPRRKGGMIKSPSLVLDEAKENLQDSPEALASPVDKKKTKKDKKDKEKDHSPSQISIGTPKKQKSSNSLDDIIGAASGKKKKKERRSPELGPTNDEPGCSRRHGGGVTKLLVSPAVYGSSSPSPADSSPSVPVTPSGSGDASTPRSSAIGTTPRKRHRHHRDRDKQKHRQVRSNSASMSSPETSFHPVVDTEQRPSCSSKSLLEDVATASTLVCSCCHKRFFAVSSQMCHHGYFCQKCIAAHSNKDGTFSCPYCKEEEEAAASNSASSLMDPAQLSLMMKRK